MIEDDPVQSHLVCYLLRAFGYDVESAADGVSGLEAAARQRPDLVLCDLGLPGISGLDVAQALRSTEGLSRIPLLAMSAIWSFRSGRERALASGFDAYILKPFTPEGFVAEIETYLPSKLL